MTRSGPPPPLQSWGDVTARQLVKRIKKKERDKLYEKTVERIKDRRINIKERIFGRDEDPEGPDGSEYDLPPRHLHMSDTDDSDSDTDSESSSEDGLPDSCCNRRCSELGAEQHLSLYQANYRMGWTDRRIFIRSRIKFQRTPGQPDRRVYYMDNIDTYTSKNGATLASLPIEMDWQSMDTDHVRVCSKYFNNLYRVSHNFIYQPAMTGSKIKLARKQRDAAVTCKANIIKQWLTDLAKWYQVSPTSADQFLPFYRKHVVWNLFLGEQATKRPKHSWSSKYFYMVWRTECEKIKVRAWLKFAKCDECIDIRKQRKATKQGACLKKIREQESAHIKFVKAERQSYYKRRLRAIEDPSQYLSMVIDGADQQAYALPYHHVQTHSSQKAIRVPIHMYGVMVHGIGTWAYVYHDSVRQGNNVTCDVLFRTLEAIEAAGRTLPDTLYLQLDNTVKQNKSKYLMSYLAWLVDTGVFKRIVVSFLPVGHTHEDIDQLFSRIAVLLRQRNARSRRELADVIQEAYHKEGLVNNCPSVFAVESVINWSDFIEPYLNPMDGITSYYQFEIMRHPDTKLPRLRVKKWCGVKSEIWRGLKSYTFHHTVFKKAVPHLLSSAIVPPSQRPEVDDEEITAKRINSLKTYADRRQIPAADIADCIDMVKRQGDDSDIVFDLSLGGQLRKAMRFADGGSSDDDNGESSGDALDDQKNQEYEYSVGDFVMIRAADTRDAKEANVSHLSLS
jgi:hypothetical protein